MIEDIEKRGFILHSEEKKAKPEPKGVESLEDDDLPSPEQTEESKKIEEKALTKEVWEKYPEEIKEITELAKGAGFKKISIVALGDGGTRFKNPDTLFFPKNHLDNFREALKFIEKKDLYKGMRVEFLELKKCFEEPKLKIYRKLSIEQNRLEKLEEEVETDEKKLMGKANDLIIGQKNVDKICKEVDEYPRTTISESGIKEQALRFTIMNILYAGIENSTAFKIARLEKLWDKKKLSPPDRQKEFLEIVSPSLCPILETFPNLDEKNIQNLGVEWFKTAKEIGEKYLKHKEKQEKHDFGIYR
jgi:hypothetical protein